MSTGSSGLAVRRGPFPWLRDARIRAKVAGILVIPLVAVLVLASVRLIEVRGRATDAGRVAGLTQLGTDLSGLSRLLHQERMAAAAFLASPDASRDSFRNAVVATDAQAQTFRRDRAGIQEVPARVQDRLTLIQERLSALSDTRGAVNARKDVTVATAVQQYSEVLDGLADYDETVSQIAEPGTVADGLRALAAFTRVQAAAADQEAAAYVVRVTGQLSAVWQQQLIGAQAARQEALDDFRQIATTDQVGVVESTLADAAVAKADGMVTRLTGAGAPSAEELTKAYAQVLDLLRSTETRLEGEVVRIAQDDSSATSRRSTLEFVVVLMVLIAAIALAAYLGRNLHLSLRRLREGALAVAHRDLPDAVSRLQDVDSLGEGGVDRIVAQTRDPIRLPDRDEFGQVAEAFNMVHREAIRVAAEQAALRTSVSAMFLSLARRSQALVDRMIGELDRIERTEEDPKRLAKLFDLDHLATRMRRNDENLLVLAGADVGAPRREDALLVDVLRAAQSEVELYHRIEFGATDTDVSVAAAAVNDVVRLIAELLDNATRFSPPTTAVVAQGRRAGDRAVVQVEDRGLGITPEQLEVINRRLAEPAAVDVAAFRLMGFAVIARLAARHGIEVRLLPHRDGGTIAEITLPPEITVLPGTSSVAPGRAASWTRPGPAPQPAGGIERAPEVRPPIRSAPAPTTAPAMPRWAGMEMGPAPDLDLRPTPDRPKLPTRVPKPDVPADLPPAPLFEPVSAAPSYSAQPVAPYSVQPVSSQPLVARPVSSQPVSSQPVSSQPVSTPEAGSIHVEMQHNWFEAESSDTPDMRGMPTAGYAPAPVAVSPAPGVSTAVRESRTGEHAQIPRPRAAAEDRWRTAADEGWQRALHASAPKDAGITTSGLPKRIPQAQLVPGGVQETPRAQNRRSPDDVRGLLSAYTRGVQRGRTDGVAESAAVAPQAPKENEQ
ncbi:nitrate- and nitrite sensing domain-containing protein [Actinoplanes sp. NPDC020271]|uniref:sensor histidine kinase n=1 Tax=Actinoplanes sp. NPDC020271 TaxID=3363896 RepID=UPI0037A5A8DB